jgi:hypothetical protein
MSLSLPLKISSASCVRNIEISSPYVQRVRIHTHTHREREREKSITITFYFRVSYILDEIDRIGRLVM